MSTGTENRQRLYQVGVRLTPEEWAEVTAIADEGGWPMAKALTIWHRRQALTDAEAAIRRERENYYTDAQDEGFGAAEDICRSLREGRIWAPERPTP